MILTSLLAASLLMPVEFCSETPEPPAIEPPAWRSRIVDGRKCFYRAERTLPQSDLIWEYDGEQLDMDEGITVRGQRHYTPAELGDIGRRMQEHRRRQQRIKRRNDDDDDD